MTRSRIRGTGPLGTAVVLAFLAALVSGPLRPCFSHELSNEKHAHGAFAHAIIEQESAEAAHAGHRQSDAPHASGTPEEEGAHGGCECVGHCQLETSPFLSLGSTRAQVGLPAPSSASGFDVGMAPTASAPYASPLARGPPPVA